MKEPREFLKILVAPLVTTPSMLRVEEIRAGDVRSRNAIYLGLTTKPDDYVFVMGKKARTIKSLQIIFRYVAKTLNLGHIGISVTDPGQHRTIETVSVPASALWNGDQMLGDLILLTLRQCGFANSSVVAQPVGQKTVFKIFSGAPMPTDLKVALGTIFFAIGRMNGRFVDLNFGE